MTVSSTVASLLALALSAADDEARTKLQAEYAADMRKLMRMLVDLEDAVAAGKADEAKALIEKVDAARERSHKAFGVDD